MTTERTTHETESAGPRPASGTTPRESRRNESPLLLAAIVLGLAVGVGVAIAARTRSRGPLKRTARRRLAVIERAVDRGARWASRRAPSLDDVGDSMSDLVKSAHDRIDDVAAREIRQLRRNIRRQRKRLGV